MGLLQQRRAAGRTRTRRRCVEKKGGVGIQEKKGRGSACVKV